MLPKLLLFDLDGTLLKSDKTISDFTLNILREIRKKGTLIGISTSRSEKNTLCFLKDLKPDILIASGGSLVKKGEECIYKACFSVKETRLMIKQIIELCGRNCEITVDTLESHYWNYKVDPNTSQKNWGDSIWTDYRDFEGEALKICVEIFDEEIAKKLQKKFLHCDSLRFSDGHWYKYTKRGITKEKAMGEVCKYLTLGYEDIMSFGDDYADIGMIVSSGYGIAMGNAVPEVKEVADLVIGSNDEDGIATYLKTIL